MPRFRLSHSAAPQGARLLAAVWLAAGCCGSAGAQIAPSVTDPLTPKLQTDPRNPPTFQKSNRAPFAQAPASAVFTPPASGAGRTGFDSSNSRKTRARTAKPKAGTDARAIAAGRPQPAPASPYQTPAKTSPAASGGAYAQAPGTPAVVPLGPIRKPVPKRKARNPDDPYAPLGLRAGAFDLFPAIELVGGYDTNPGRSPNAKGASLYTVAPELRAQSNWSRHELKADLRGSYTGYSPDETPTLSRPNVNGKVDGRIDVTRTTRVDLGGRVLVATDNPGSPNLQAGLSKLPIYTTFGGGAGLGQRFNRFDVSVKGDAERTVYQDSQLTDGSTASNEARNYDQYGGTLRGGYELSPGLMPFIEAGLDTRKHDLNADSLGYQRDSKGFTGSVGATFELTRQLTGNVSVGYVKRTYEDPRLQDLSGLIGNASLVWTATTLTTVKLTASSTVGESTVPGVSGVLYRDVGVQVDHAFRQWLVGSLKLGVGVDTYKGLSTEATTTVSSICNCVVVTNVVGGGGPDRQDLRYSLGAGLTYKLDRNIQFKGEFRQDWMKSNASNVDYAASVFLLGVRVQQ